MSKRGAGSYLTHDNWDDEDDEKEEAGEFKQADADTLKTRKIKTAKRKGLGEKSNETSGTGGVFKGFTGFTNTAAKPAFSFSSTESKPFGGLDSKPLGSGGLMFGSKPSAETPSSSETAVSSNGKEDANTSIKNGSSKTSSKYMVHLKALNETVTKWIKDHVDKNPYILLTPVFEDYKTHLAELERKYGTKNESSGSENAAASEGDKEKKTPEKEKGTDTVSSSEKPPGFSFSTFSSNASVPKTTSTPAFSFGGTTTTVSSSDEKKATSGFAGFGSTGGFSFGKPEGSATSGFSFGSTAAGTGAFSFATSKPSNSGDAKADEEEEYVPPKPESSNITEEDAFYNKRVKLFFKQDGDWKDRGVGLLFLKPCDDKTQLLIRADTSIGNILLNIMLNKSMPVSRTGKNNVMTMCIPNPPLDEKKPDENTAVGMLLRVKTTEDADELAEKLKEYKDK